MSVRLNQSVLAALTLLASLHAGRSASASVALQDLINGGSVNVGGAVFSDWQLLQDLGTITPDFSQIRVESLLSGPGQLGLRFEGNGQFTVQGNTDSIILTLGYRVQSVTPFAANQQRITDFAFSGSEGLIDIQEQVKNAGGALLSVATTTLDPAFGINTPFASATILPQNDLQVMTSLSLFGNDSTSGVALRSFEQTFSQVPEPSSLLAFGAVFAVGAAWRLTRRVHWRSCVSFGVLLTAAVAHGADHLDAPAVALDGRLDINDVYAFQSPSNPANAVIAVTVNPLSGVLSPSTFSAAGRYEIKIDNNGDALADITFEITFGPPDGNGRQRVALRRNGALIARGLTGTNVPIQAAGGGMLRCDLFDDPFFFDLTGFRASPINFTGTDFFKGLNVTAIVLEVPSSTLGANSIGIWARTEVGGIQFDRMGRPAINTVLIPSSMKNAFNAGKPVDDLSVFGATVIARITALSGGDASFAAGVTGVLLPDLLTVDTSSSAGFLNGRRLADDVIDVELNLLTKGALPGDGVNANDKIFSGAFPYLASPH